MTSSSMIKAEVNLEIKSSAAEFYEIFRSKVDLLPKIVPQVIKDVQLLKGCGNLAEHVGSVREWTFAPGTKVPKETTEVKDESKLIAFNVLEAASVTICYKTMKETLQVTPKYEGSLVNWTILYEKQKEDAPPLERYLEVIASIIKAVDVYLQNV